MAASAVSDRSTIYFFREFEEPYGFLSQWYTDSFTAPSAVHGEGDMTFVTAEQYMMYRKAMVFNDTDAASEIMQTKEPKKQKALGRKVKGFNADTWDKVKEQAVEDGNYFKFSRSETKPEMRKVLLETGERFLVEASHFDRVWGIGFSAANAKKNRSKWGQNLLGQAIMRARARLKAEEETQAANEEVDST